MLFLKHRAALLILFLGLVLSSVFFVRAREFDYSGTNAKFEKKSREFSDQISEKISHILNVLYSVRSLYLATEEVERSEFNKFVMPLLEKNPEIYSVAWLPFVRDEERVAFEASAANLEGNPQFIQERNQESQWIRAKNRKLYFPIAFIEPETAFNRAMMYWDLGSDIAHRDIMMKSWKGDSVLSTPIMEMRPFGELGFDPLGFVVYIPVYENNLATDLADDEKSLQGFIAATMNLERMIQFALRGLYQPSMSAALFTQMQESKMNFIARYDFGLGHAIEYDENSLPRHAWMSLEQVIPVFGQIWLIKFYLEKEAFLDHGMTNSEWIFVLGILLSLLASVYIYSVENRKLQRYFEHLSHVDPLTGLYNLRGFQILAEQQIRHAKRNKKGFYLIMLDLDGLKAVNDSLGHCEGDLLINEAARVLKDSFRESDIVSRVGGDEFVVLVLEHALEDDKKIVSLFQQRLSQAQTGQRAMSVSFSMGAAGFDPHHPSTISEMMAEADRAMYDEKRSKKGKLLAFK